MSEYIYTKENLGSICMDALIIYEVAIEHESEFREDGSYPDTFGGAIRKYRHENGTYALRDWCIDVAKRLNTAWYDADRKVKAKLGEYDPSECVYDFEWVPEVLLGFYTKYSVYSLDEYPTTRFEFYAMRDWVERFTDTSTSHLAVLEIEVERKQDAS